MFNHSFVKRSQAQLKIAKKLIFVVKGLFFSLFSGIKKFPRQFSFHYFKIFNTGIIGLSN